MKNTITFLIAFLVIVPLTKARTLNLVPPVKKITIYWDTSLSMIDKDIDKELSFLAAYFNKTPNAIVDLITFSTSIDAQQRFTIVNSNWNNLKEVLLKTTYDGVAFYDVLLQETTSDLNFLFTDGIEVIDKLILNKTTPTYVINSSQKRNLAILNQQNQLSNNIFIDLTKTNTQQALALLSSNKFKKEIVTKRKKPKKHVIREKLTQNNGFITGSVYSSEGALFGATISINGETGVVTDNNGEFTIKANEGDILIASYLGMQTQEILISKKRRFEILLLNDETELEEVVVKGKSKYVEEEVETGYGKVNKEKIGYAVQSIDYEDLPEGRDDNLSVHGKFSGITSYGQNDDISQMVIRGAFSIFLTRYPLVVIDGIQLNRSNSFTQEINLTNFVDPNNVASVTILKGLAATNRYGGQGGNGVILITTKSSLAGKKNKNSQNTALAKDNDFTENLSSISTIINEKYIDELNQFKTLNEVYNHYLKQRIHYFNDPLYFVNISDFILQFGNKEIASKILSNILELYPKDISLLKLVAYKAEQQQDFFFAKRIYEKIAKLKPRDAQSYRDLALSYQETGYYQKALDIYKKILNKDYSGVDFSGIQKVIT
ncbi:carboxypeptidase-like regulatory domain-containing protein, partial [Lutibacter sp.]